MGSATDPITVDAYIRNRTFSKLTASQGYRIPYAYCSRSIDYPMPFYHTVRFAQYEQSHYRFEPGFTTQPYAYIEITAISPKCL